MIGKNDVERYRRLLDLEKSDRGASQALAVERRRRRRGKATVRSQLFELTQLFQRLDEMIEAANVSHLRAIRMAFEDFAEPSLWDRQREAMARLRGRRNHVNNLRTGLKRKHYE